MDFLNIFRALYLYKKIRRENDTTAIKISYVTPSLLQSEGKRHQNHEKFQLAEFDSPKMVNMTKTRFAKTHGKTFQFSLGLD